MWAHILQPFFATSSKHFWNDHDCSHFEGAYCGYFCTTLTCSNPGQSCPAPSCLPNDQGWPLAGDSLFPNHGSAGQYLHRRTLHMGALWSGKQTAKDQNKTRFTPNQHLLTYTFSITKRIPFWPHHKSEGQVLWLEPGQEKWDTAYDEHTFHSPAWKRPKQKA